MAKIVRDNKTGRLQRIELGAHELAEKLQVSVDELKRWTEVIEPYQSAGETVYAVSSQDELETLRKRAAILKCRTSPETLKQIEKKGMLEAFAGLAQDCPKGIPLEVWRSYGLIVLMQVKANRRIGPAELAERANLIDKNGKPDVEKATKHIQLLVNVSRSLWEESEERWGHNGLPESWRGAV